MKALIGNIQKFSTEDGPGIRTTVFLKGCPLHCKWCHNPELIDFRQQIIEMPNSCIRCGYCLEHCPSQAIAPDEEGRIRVDRTLCSLCMECTHFCYAGALKAVAQEMTPEEVMYQVTQDAGFYQETGGGMTISGGEMLAQPEFTEALIDLAEQQNIAVCLDTSGYGDGERLLALAARDAVDYILYDLKSLDDAIHQEFTGVSNAGILANLRVLASDERTRNKVWMRMPLIRGINDHPELIRETAVLYQELGIRNLTLLPYHDLGISKTRNIGEEPVRFQPPEEERIQEIRGQFEKDGMNVEILGRV